MANEILPASIGDLVAGEVLANEYLMLLADRDASILSHPALLKASAPSGASNVVRVPHIGLGGYDALAARTPGTEVANTALADASTDVTIAPYSKVYAMDDFAQWMLEGRINEQMFAQDAAISVAQKLISLIANITDGFAASTGSGDLTWDVVMGAITTLEVAKAGGPAIALLHPYQWGDLRKSAASAGVSLSPAVQGSLDAALGGSYKGRYMGVDFYTSSAVPLDTGNYKGALFTRGAVAWADTVYPTVISANAMSFGNAVFEMDRRASFAETKMVTHTNLGVALGIDAAGITLISAST